VTCVTAFDTTLGPRRVRQKAVNRRGCERPAVLSVSHNGGTVRACSPEHLPGRRVDTRADEDFAKQLRARSTKSATSKTPARRPPGVHRSPRVRKIARVRVTDVFRRFRQHGAGEPRRVLLKKRHAPGRTLQVTHTQAGVLDGPSRVAGDRGGSVLFERLPSALLGRLPHAVRAYDQGRTRRRLPECGWLVLPLRRRTRPSVGASASRPRTARRPPGEGGRSCDRAVRDLESTRAL
jgi:hypothetical protein